MIFAWHHSQGLFNWQMTLIKICGKWVLPRSQRMDGSKVWPEKVDHPLQGPIFLWGVPGNPFEALFGANVNPVSMPWTTKRGSQFWTRTLFVGIRTRMTILRPLVFFSRSMHFSSPSRSRGSRLFANIKFCAIAWVWHEPTNKLTFSEFILLQPSMISSDWDFHELLCRFNGLVWIPFLRRLFCDEALACLRSKQED